MLLRFRINDWINMLATIIELTHKCHAVHMESLPVTERADGRTIWEGTVHVFALVGHLEATRCYGWAIASDVGPPEFVSALQQGPVNSPQTAVQAWLESRAAEVDTFTETRPGSAGGFGHEDEEFELSG